MRIPFSFASFRRSLDSVKLDGEKRIASGSSEIASFRSSFCRSISFSSVGALISISALYSLAPFLFRGSVLSRNHSCCPQLLEYKQGTSFFLQFFSGGTRLRLQSRQSGRSQGRYSAIFSFLSFLSLLSARNRDRCCRAFAHHTLVSNAVIFTVIKFQPLLYIIYANSV